MPKNTDKEKGRRGDCDELCYVEYFSDIVMTMCPFNTLTTKCPPPLRHKGVYEHKMP